MSLIDEEKLRKLIKEALRDKKRAKVRSISRVQDVPDDADNTPPPAPDGSKAAYNAKYGKALKKLEDSGVDTSDIRNGTSFVFPVSGPCYNAGYDVPTMGRKGKKGIASARKKLSGKRTELVHSKYGIQNNDWTSKHKGIDIFCLDGSSKLQACVTGIITKIGKNSGKGGNTITVTRGDPNNAENFYYAHLNSHAKGFSEKSDVGKKVTMGTVIGYCGKTGSAIDTYPHLHFSYYVGGNYSNSNTDPWKYLEPALRRDGATRVGQKRGIRDYIEITDQEAQASVSACAPKHESIIGEDSLRILIKETLRDEKRAKVRSITGSSSNNDNLGSGPVDVKDPVSLKGGNYPQENVRHVEAAMTEKGITNKYIRIGILCTIAKESNFKPKSEKTYQNTGTDRIFTIWPKLKKMGKEKLDQLKKSTSPSDGHKQAGLGFFDYLYGGRYGNGPKESGDGSRYRGRGFNQVTFKGTYEKYASLSGIDIVSNPDKLNQPDVAAKVAVAFLANRLKSHYGSVNPDAKSYDEGIKMAATANCKSKKGKKNCSRAISSATARLKHFSYEGNSKNV